MTNDLTKPLPIKGPNNLYSSLKLFGVTFIQIACAAALALGVGFLLDQSISQTIDNPAWNHFVEIAHKITDIGLAGVYFSLSAVIGLWSLIKKNKKMQLLSESLFLSLVLAGLCTTVLKFLIGRQRPFVSTDHAAWIFKPFNTDSHFQSFPSGHSQATFTAATVFAVLFPKHKYLLFLTAAFIAFTRIFSFNHFLSDVIFGAGIGLFVTKAFLPAWKAKRERDLGL